MRLLRTTGSDMPWWLPRLCTRDDQPYAILSHCWSSQPNDEILFADIEEIDRISDSSSATDSRVIVRNAQYAGPPPRTKLGYDKVLRAAQQALRDGFQYIWVDTCCIDKSSSTELSEAINSMWKWYESSSVCYAYLADMPDRGSSHETWEREFSRCRWWKRGWTLQELLASRNLYFYSCNWNFLGHKKQLDRIISEISWVDTNVINGTLPISAISIAQRMSWASRRETSRPEDIAYCLMGLFSVNMPLLYGEGEKAFLRLQEEIMKDSDDQSIFAWKEDKPNSGLLASQPAAFEHSQEVVYYADKKVFEPYSMTNKGLSITRELCQSDDGNYIAVLWCTDAEHGTGIFLREVSHEGQQYERVRCNEWAFVDLSHNYITRKIFIKPSDFHISELMGLTHSFRLFRIVQTHRSMDIKITLFPANMMIAKYLAVENTCRPTGIKTSIFIDNKRVEVSLEDYTFLQWAQLRHSNELWWLRSICYPKKSSDQPHQALSGIFEKAFKTKIWDDECHRTMRGA